LFGTDGKHAFCVPLRILVAGTSWQGAGDQEKFTLTYLSGEQTLLLFVQLKYCLT